MKYEFTAIFVISRSEILRELANFSQENWEPICIVPVPSQGFDIFFKRPVEGK